MASGVALLLISYGLQFIQGQSKWQRRHHTQHSNFDQTLNDIETARATACADTSSAVRCTYIQAHWLQIEKGALITWKYVP